VIRQALDVREDDTATLPAAALGGIRGQGKRLATVLVAAGKAGGASLHDLGTNKENAK